MKLNCEQAYQIIIGLHGAWHDGAAVAPVADWL